MLTRINFLLFLVAAFAFFSTTTTYASENKVVNASFESSAENWKTNNSNVTFDILNSPFKEGTQSAMIINSSTTSYGIEQTITNIIPEQKYRISGYVRITDPPAQKAFIRVAWYSSLDATGSQITTHDSPMLSDFTDWQLLEFFPNAAANAQSAKVRLLTTNGAAIFDDIHFEVYTEPTATESPTTTNVPPTPTPTTSGEDFSYDNIFISEVMPAPSPGNPEWIELYNANDFDVTLADWYIDDSANGGSTPKKMSINIPKKSYIAIDFSTSLFNNAGDSARLLDSSEVEKDYISYGETEADYSFGRNDFSNHTVCMQIPTKAATNGTCIQVDEEPEQTTATPTHVQSVSPTKFITKKITPHALHNYYDDFKSNTKVSALKNFDKQKAETVLGETISIHNNSKPRSPVTHLTLLSMSYSILSIISLCVKIALA